MMLNLDQLVWQVLQGWSGRLGVLNGQRGSSQGRGGLHSYSRSSQLAHTAVEILHGEGVRGRRGESSLLLLLLVQ